MTYPINAASHVGISSYESAESLSGEALLTYISTRLSSFDSEINAHMSEQNRALAKKENLQHIKNFCGKVKASKDGEEISHADLEQAKAELMQELSDDPALRAEVDEMFLAEARPHAGAGNTTPGAPEPREPVQGWHGQSAAGVAQAAETVVSAQKEPMTLEIADDFGKYSTEELDVKLDELDQQISQVTSNSEITMIRLQQLMSQRQTSVQLTTNVLSKYNQGDESVIGNIR